MSVFDEPGSTENQPANGTEPADKLPVEGYLVIQQYKLFSYLVIFTALQFDFCFHCLILCNYYRVCVNSAQNTEPDPKNVHSSKGTGYSVIIRGIIKAFCPAQKRMGRLSRLL